MWSKYLSFHRFINSNPFHVKIFIVTKNNLTYNNGYAALYFCLFIGLIPSCLEENSILVSNLFILLSFRRIMSLKTNSNIKKKLLDASMWICLAAIFEPWAILFFLVLFFQCSGPLAGGEYWRPGVAQPGPQSLL